MEVFNIEYTNSTEALDKLIVEKSLSLENNLLIQIFDGKYNKQTTKKVIDYLVQKLPLATIIGASTAGEINTRTTEHKFIISFSVFKHTQVSVVKEVVCDNLNCQGKLGVKIKEELIKPDTKVLFLFGAGQINPDVVLSNLETEDSDYVIAGGLAGDNLTFQGTYVICQNEIINNGVVAVSLDSTVLSVHNDFSLKWNNIGKTFIVNKVEGNEVFEIDHLNPIDFYKKYLGEEVAKALPAIGIEFPLLIVEEDGFVKARAVLFKNTEKQSLVFAGSIPVGAEVSLGIGDLNHITEGAEQVAQNLLNKPVEGVYVYSCVARKSFMGSMVDDDLLRFSLQVPTVGFYTYGEFFTHNKTNSLLNETFTMLALSEQPNTIYTTQLKDNFLKCDLGYHKSQMFQVNMEKLRFNALVHFTNVMANELRKSNDDLHDGLVEATKELVDLNQELEKRVEQEINLNREKELQLMRVSKNIAMGEMIANIAHQWRQPLTTISTIVSGVQLEKEMGILEDTDLDEYMNNVIEQVHYLSKTIDTFRNFLKEGDGQKHQELVKNKINDAIMIIQQAFKNKNIDFIRDCNDGATKIFMRENELTEVLINILNNAKDILVEKNIKNPWVKMTTSVQSGLFIITIEDNGGGVPDDIRDYIFDPYFTTKHKSQGTGLGLHMGYKIITESLKGTLKVENTENGAMFIIQVPINV